MFGIEFLLSSPSSSSGWVGNRFCIFGKAISSHEGGCTLAFLDAADWTANSDGHRFFWSVHGPGIFWGVLFRYVCGVAQLCTLCLRDSFTSKGFVPSHAQLRHGTHLCRGSHLLHQVVFPCHVTLQPHGLSSKIVNFILSDDAALVSDVIEHNCKSLSSHVSESRCVSSSPTIADVGCAS